MNSYKEKIYTSCNQIKITIPLIIRKAAVRLVKGGIIIDRTAHRHDGFVPCHKPHTNLYYILHQNRQDCLMQEQKKLVMREFLIAKFRSQNNFEDSATDSEP